MTPLPSVAALKACLSGSKVAVVATPVPISNAAANPAKTEASKAPVVREVSPSAPISKDLPAYPETARRMKIEGKVDVDAQVDEQGSFVDLRLAVYEFQQVYEEVLPAALTDIRHPKDELY